VNRFVVSQPLTDTWGVRAPGALDFESVHASGAEATAQARAVVRSLGGGQVFIQGADGHWVEADDAPTDDTTGTAG